MVPSVEGLLPKQIEILRGMIKQMADCEADIPMEHWCRPCTDKYMRILELIYRWRKQGTYFAKGRWWCNYARLPKFSTDTRYRFTGPSDDDKNPNAPYYNPGGKK